MRTQVTRNNKANKRNQLTKGSLYQATTENQFLRIMWNGEVLRSMRLTIKATCPMNLANFPMDTQVHVQYYCTVHSYLWCLFVVLLLHGQVFNGATPRFNLHAVWHPLISRTSDLRCAQWRLRALATPCPTSSMLLRFGKPSRIPVRLWPLAGMLGTRVTPQWKWTPVSSFLSLMSLVISEYYLNAKKDRVRHT